jgi:hypothetical protein
MGCGCKNKGNQTQPQTVSTPQQSSQNQTLAQVQGQTTNNSSIQESIK